ncbi:PQQ-dependent dehydrogenase, methanol/ethanol family [Pacificimonas sp. WHA3]|uniref:PQQ-dependent dehydrogenase, methanol/ethanol family n=1 Tax=Pacificimonas pallii TaxID=2827236 RepID=A0ABS6SFL5_9SPHN|nr:PQQ-dependent dehydrogenase, methanol/ethanol family [Pacificimonas pallii]MBV7256721.1 PQQ-dependent dehydrogenase, methanol/ethanol family [Pacificimonas pallii]
MRYIAIGAAIGALAIMSACAPEDRAPENRPAADVTDERLLNAAAEPGSWLTHGGTYEEQRFARLTGIDRTNVDKLGLAWMYEFDTNRGQEATPLIVDGVLYTTSAWSKVFAFNAKTGELLWSYDPEVPREAGFNACCDVVNRGVAIYGGRVYSGTIDGRLIAIDAQTGKLAWEKVTVDQSKPYTITGAPRAAKGRVLIGNGGAEYGVRGYVSAYDAETGALDWRFYTVPPGPDAGPDGAASDSTIDLAKATWNGDWSEHGGGGTVWDAIVYDRDFDQILIGVGNGAPWNHKLRSDGEGDNLFVSSVVALDADTGTYKWHYQGTPGETWDFTQTQPIILADLPIDGIARKVMMQAPKNGYFYVIDRGNGELISAEGFVPQTWTTGIDMATGRPIEAENARFTDGTFLSMPSALGAHNWHPMAYSPDERLVYIPAQDVPYAYVDDANFESRPGAWNIGVDYLANPVPETRGEFKALKALLKGHLAAWDPVTQTERWRVQHDGPWNGGVLATQGGLVFQGTAKGDFKAYDAENGEELWSFAAGTGIIAAPVSYEIDGEQYVAVMAGYGGAYPLTTAYEDNPKPQINGRLLVFRLGAAIPYDVASLEYGDPVQVEAFWTEDQLAHGNRLYESNCGVCHGAAARSSGVLPDLRRSGWLETRELWQEVLIGGALKDQGMISFAKWFSPEDAEAVRAFVASRANRLIEDGDIGAADGQRAAP